MNNWSNKFPPLSAVTYQIKVNNRSNKFPPLSAVTYQIKVKISDNTGAGTTDSQYVKVKGTSGETDEAQCSGDFSSQNSEVTCSFTSDSNIGHYDCVSWRTGGTDSFSFSKVLCSNFGYVGFIFKS